VSRITTAQATVWRRWRSHHPDAPERFTPGRYRCPVHGGPRRDLSIRYLPGENRVLLHCFDGCPHPAILARLGLRFGDLSDYGGASGTLEGTYTYTDEDGRELLRVHRYTGPVDVRYEVWRDGAWTWDSPARGPHLLYRLPAVSEAVEVGEHVYVVEGERHADALVAAGAVATTTAQRPGRPWKTDHLERLRDAYCTVVARRDEAGRRRARTLVAALSTVAADVRLVEPATNRDHAGAAEHLVAGFGLDDFTPLAAGEAPTVDAALAEPVPLDQGGELLDQVEAFLRRFVVFAADAQAVAVALWVAHTWCFAAAETTPYLHVTSPEKRSGKSRLVEVLAQLARGALQAANMTAAALYRSIIDPAPALLFDEVQELFGRGADDDQRQLRACLHSGYRLGGAARRCVGEGTKQTVAEFPTFCPKVLAGTGSLPDMLADRAIAIQLQRRTRDEPVERFRIRRIRGEVEALRRRLAGWAQAAVPVLHDADPELPEQLDDRAQDCWEPLLALAELAGGDWPKRARVAAVELAGGDRLADPSTGTLLLAHCWEAFAGEDADRLATARLLELLCGRDDGPWAEWWGKYLHDDGQAKVAAARLAKLLRRFGIAPKVLDFDGRKARGYALSAFSDAFGRYLPSGDLRPATLPRNSAAQGTFSDVTEIGRLRRQKPLTSSVTRLRPQAQEPGPTRLRADPATTQGGRRDSARGRDLRRLRRAAATA
jgi:Protein of unknown function (DUF3631)